MDKGVRVVVVCEDLLTETFCRAFLCKRGFTRHQLTFKKPPTALGDAKAGVIKRLADEAEILLKGRYVGKCVLCVIDADNESVEERRNLVMDGLKKRGIANPAAVGQIFLFIPKWEIENWIEYLRVGIADEGSSRYDKFKHREASVYAYAEKLADDCIKGAVLPNAPPSLIGACKEFSRFAEWLRNNP